MLKTLRYASCMGAPVTPVIEEIFESQRVATRAVLLCFHVAGRLSRWRASSKRRAMWAACDPHVVARERAVRAANRAMWGAMARMPRELVEKLLVHADLEIPESFGRRLFAQRSACVPLKDPCLPWANGVKEYAIAGAF